MTKLSAIAALLVGALSTGALADTSGGGTSSTVTLNFTYACRGSENSSSSGGGSRVITGTWDTTSGALSVTVTLTNCMGRDGLAVTGTDVITGTLQPGTTPSSFTINTSEVINTKATSANGNDSLTRTCTITRAGSFSQDTFTGKTTRTNCVLDGTYREEGSDVRIVHLLENMLKRAVNSEEE